MNHFRQEKQGFEQELTAAINIARQAGALVQPYYDQPIEVSWKGENDPVTAADKAANEYIVAKLQQLFSDDGILAEESADNEQRLGKERLWCIDPLDGTKEFIAHNGEFCIMIGLAIGGKAKLGVLYQPIENKLYYGIVGVGAWKEEHGEKRPLHVSIVNDVTKMTAAFSRSHRPPLTVTLSKQLGITNEVISGSVGLKIALLSEQKADVYLHPSTGTKEWDTCGPEAVLRAAGGEMTDMWGRPLCYNKQDPYNYVGILASNGQIHAYLVEEAKIVLEHAGVQPEIGFSARR